MAEWLQGDERQHRGGGWLHLVGVACALLAVIDAVVTIAAADQRRPRILALCLAVVSAIALLLGWRRFAIMGRVDALLLIALDAWVLADLGW